MGMDSDHPLAAGEVGRVGVAIDSLADMERLFDGIPLDEDHHLDDDQLDGGDSAVPLRAGRANGRARIGSKLSGTIQNDILKEYIARGTYIYPPRPAMRIITDLFAWAGTRDCRSGTRSRSAAITFAKPARPPCRKSRSRSPTPSPISKPRSTPGWTWMPSRRGSLSSSTRITIFWKRSPSSAPRGGCGRTSCASASARSDPRSLHAALSRADRRLHADRAAARRTTSCASRSQALAAVLGGTQSLHTNSRDEALALPTEESARLALRTQQIIAHESGVTEAPDPLGGSDYIERLTDEIEAAAPSLHRHASTRWAERCAPSRRVSSRAKSRTPPTNIQRAVEAGERQIVVGVNRFQSRERRALARFKIDPELESQQIERLRQLRANRSAASAAAALRRSETAARADRTI